MTETDYCPLTGDRPHPAPLPHGWEWTADAIRDLEALAQPVHGSFPKEKTE